MICLSCFTETEIRHYDPKTPPLGEGEILCRECWESNAIDALQELQGKAQKVIDYAKGNETTIYTVECCSGLMSAGFICCDCGSAST